MTTITVLAPALAALLTVAGGGASAEQQPPPRTSPARGEVTERLSQSAESGGRSRSSGGHILGRHIELVPDRRIVQAWRVANWDAGVYSVVRFELSAEGSGTRLVFDHTGFPEGQAAHLAEGWRTNYWEPLAKYLASPDGAASPPGKP